MRIVMGDGTRSMIAGGSSMNEPLERRNGSNEKQVEQVGHREQESDWTIDGVKALCKRLNTHRHCAGTERAGSFIELLWNRY